MNLLIMNLKKQESSLHEIDLIDYENAKDYPTLADLIKEQNISSDDACTVHYRRDLDSLG